MKEPCACVEHLPHTTPLRPPAPTRGKGGGSAGFSPQQDGVAPWRLCVDPKTQRREGAKAQRERDARKVSTLSRCPCSPLPLPPSRLAPHTSRLTPHTSRLAPHTSRLAPHTSRLTPHTSRLTPLPPSPTREEGNPAGRQPPTPHRRCTGGHTLRAAPGNPGGGRFMRVTVI